MMNSGMHSSKTAIIHKAKVLNNQCSPCPTPATFEKPKKTKFKDQTFTVEERKKERNERKYAKGILLIFKHPQHVHVNFTGRGAKNVQGNKQEHFKLML